MYSWLIIQKNQGFDALQLVGGFINPRGAIPTEQKALQSANPQAVLSETVDTEQAANGVRFNGQPLTGVQIFISAPNMSANAVAEFARNGPLTQNTGGGHPSLGGVRSSPLR
jgi:hypothetical protein